MIFHTTSLAGALLVEMERRIDERGSFARTFSVDEFAAAGLETELVQDNTSFNTVAGTLRGMHLQRSPQEEVKLVRCVRGAVHDVIVDLRPESPTFLRWEAFHLDEDCALLLYIPKGFAHGFLTLRDRTEVVYRMAPTYRPGYEVGFRYDDPAFGIAWPQPIVRIAQKDLDWPPYRAD